MLDGMYCSQVEVGEAAPRLMASGLRKYIPVDHFLNRDVCVVCNLKPRKMVSMGPAAFLRGGTASSVLLLRAGWR